MRRRILALWQTGAKTFRFGENLILFFPESVRVDCRRAFGLPLVRYDKILSAFPLEKRDLEFFEFADETIILSVQGNIETISIGDLTIEKPENWIDVSAFQIVETETLGEIKTNPIVVEKIEKIDLREELGEVPKADEKLSEILQMLRQKTNENRKNGGIFHNKKSSTSNAFGSFFDSLKNLFSSKSGEFQTLENSSQNSPNKLRKLWTKALFQMKIGQILGRKQAKYLSEMMEMFERGDLDEALKRAIPLEDMQSLKQMSEQMPFLGFLRPRSNLHINYGRQTPSSSSVMLGNQWFSELRELYRQTFDRLVAQNRLEEAAFVLAELLKSNEEAVNFLEKHKKFRLAAQLAESRNLPKETIVRQWFLSGEKKRAVQIAIQHNCFDYAVTRFEKEKHPQAAELREIWAESLAESGNLTAAVNTLWKLENKRERANEWIDKVIEFGGSAAGEMLAKKLSLSPESFTEVKEKLFKNLMENGFEAEEKRTAFASEALKLTPNAELRMLIKPVARKILADGFGLLTAQNFRQIIEFSGDYALRTDLPKLSKTAAGKVKTLIVEIAENDCGAAVVFDACLLPDGKIAVALGESGVKILSQKGKQIAHFDQPTHKFVVSDFGTKAIGLASRGETFRLTKFDFLNRHANYWCDASFSTFAPTYDGNLWFISSIDGIYAIDAHAKDFEAIWRVSEVGYVYEISRPKAKLMLLVNIAGKGFEKWWYDLPSFTLRSRNQPKGWYETDNEQKFLAEVSSFVAHSVVLKQEFDAQDKIKFEVEIFDYETRIATIEFPPEIIIERPQIVEKTYVLIEERENETIVSLYEIPKTQIAIFRLKNSKRTNVKLDDKNLTIADECGRVIIFDHREKILRRNVRI